MFSRPKHPHPTRHLFVGNCGPGAGVPEIDVLRIFREFGEPTLDGVSTSVRHLFVTYPSETSASAAVAALHGRPSYDGRLITVKFAEAGKLRQEPALPQQAAKSAQACGVPGLELYPDFITAAEELALLDAVADGPWETLARRRVQHFGHRFEYLTRGVLDEAAAPMPQQLQPVLRRLALLPGLAHLDQATVNEYMPGVGLSPHIDTHSAFTGAIVSLSLGGPAVMEFRRGAQQRSLFLPPRSLLVLAGESRYAWAHYIPHRKSDVVEGETLVRTQPRVSITLRQVRRIPCDCGYPEDCDSQLGCLPPTRKAVAAAAAATAAAAAAALSSAAAGTAKATSDGCRPEPKVQACMQSQEVCSASTQRQTIISAGPAAEVADSGTVRWPAPELHEGHSEAGLQALEDQMVNGVYNAIAPHFSATRFAIWPRVRDFIEGLPVYAVVADVGCGNGKYFGVRRDIAVLGSDRSSGLAQVAAQHLLPGRTGGAVTLADVAVADGFHLPYRSGSCDAVLCIAVLHHMSSPARRLRLLQELLRILRPGGRALVTVWAEEQEHTKKMSKWQPLAGLKVGSGLAAQTPENSGSNAPAMPLEETLISCDGRAPSRNVSPSKIVSSSGRDFLVPWHVPLHRAEAASAASAALASERVAVPVGTSQATASVDSAQGVGACGSRAAQNFSEVAVGSVNREKGTVVFQRYYHLFKEQELRELAQQVEGMRTAQTFYDKSNWCLVLESA